MHVKVWATFVVLLGCGDSDGSDGSDSSGSAVDGSTSDTTTGSTAGSSESASTSDGESSTGEVAPIGELVEHGTRDFDQSTLDPPACADVCTRLGGWCDDSAAGRSYYDCETESQGGNFYSCTYPEEPEYINGNGELCRLTEYACRCHDVLLERPYVRVTTAVDGSQACDAVCGSWNLLCDWGGDTYDVDGDLLQSLECADVPADDAVTYDCHCRPA